MRSSTPSKSRSNGTTSGTRLRGSDRYDFGSVVVRGRTGVLHRGLDTRQNCAVLLKLLRPAGEGRSRERAEIKNKASTLCCIDHPNVADVRDFGRHHGLAFVASETVQGISLANYLERFGPLPWTRFAPCFRAILAGLAVAHRHGIVHGDIQPSHLVFTTDTDAIDGLEIVGFGFPDLIGANRSTDSNQTSLATDVEAISPERIEGKAVDQRMDLYALGDTAYRMLTGRPPFPGDDFHFLFQHVHDDPPPLAELVPQNHRIPDSLFAFVDTLLAKDPDDRPADADAALEWFQSRFGEVSKRPLDEVPMVSGGDRSSAGASSEDIEIARPSSSDGSNRRASSPGSSSETSDHRWLRRTAEILGGLLLFAASVGGGWYAVVGFEKTERPSSSSAPPDRQPEPDSENRLRTETLFAKIDNAIDSRRFSTAHSLLERLEPRLHHRPDLQKKASSYTLRLRIAQTFERAKRLEAKFKIPDAIDHYRQIVTVDPDHARARTRLDELLDSVALRVDSNIKAAVYVDGQPVGITPMSELVSKRASKVSVRRQGYNSWSTSLEAEGGQQVELQAELEEATYESGEDRSEADSAPGSYDRDMLMDMGLD